MNREKKEELKLAYQFLKNLPSGRKIFFKIGPIMVELTKEEALKKLEEEINKEDTKKD